MFWKYIVLNIYIKWDKTRYNKRIKQEIIIITKFLIQIFQIITSEDSITEVSVPTISVIALAFYMFFANFFGQNIIDHNNEIYAAA